MCNQPTDGARALLAALRADPSLSDRLARSCGLPAYVLEAFALGEAEPTYGETLLLAHELGLEPASWLHADETARLHAAGVVV